MRAVSAAVVLIALLACQENIPRYNQAAAGAGGSAFEDPSCGDGGTCRAVPAPPGVPPDPAAVGASIIAIEHLYFGDTDRQGTPSATAWKQFGYDLDGLVSTPEGTNHCKLVKGANPTNVQQDGEGGIDNGFGASLLPLFTPITPGVATDANQRIANGEFTILLRLQNIQSPSTHPDQSGIRAALYRGADKGGPAAFDGSDVWPVADEDTIAGDASMPVNAMPKSYVTHGTWVSGFANYIHVPIFFFDQRVEVTLSVAVVTMDLTSTGATHGVIAGVIPTEPFIAALATVAGNLDKTLCGSTFDSIAQQIREASDIMADGTNGDPTKTCDAISIGIGFNGVAAQLGSVAPPETPPPDPCAP